MVLSPAILGITAAIELIRFVQTSRELAGKSPKEVLEMWAATREDVRLAMAAWRASAPSEEDTDAP